MDSTKELHYRYGVSYLLVAIILLIALAYYNVPNLVDKFTFALTLSSLLLAVLAIFYTIISAQKQDRQLSRLVETNANLDSAALEIKKAAGDIRLFAIEAPQHFQTIGLKLDSINANYGTLRSSQQTDVEGKKDEAIIHAKIDKTQFFEMFTKLQFAAMAVVYLFERSYVKGKSIDSKTIESLEINSFDYTVGILNGLEAAGLLNFKIHKGDIVPTNCLKVVSEETKASIVRVQAVVDELSSERLKKTVEAIDAHVA